MKKTVSGILIVMAMTVLSGCQHDSSAVGSDGRPHAPSGQASPGGTQGSGPVGQPQS
ncbi:hypothetical protein [Erwinia billingiae]|jgi:hypothetical protein|uniref:hypothetical protein n=1 Tax=Erwinia billingiae TaxID=182337 RepID=UPI00069DB88A|nr:hypothetical protein [Erwinia billingiae]